MTVSTFDAIQLANAYSALVEMTRHGTFHLPAGTACFSVVKRLEDLQYRLGVTLFNEANLRDAYLRAAALDKQGADTARRFFGAKGGAA